MIVIPAKAGIQWWGKGELDIKNLILMLLLFSKILWYTFAVPQSSMYHGI
jgi:hypothetical protein